MDTDTVSVLNEIPCKECFNFMTVEVNTNNLFYLGLKKNNILKKHLEENKYWGVPIWYCKKGLLPNKVYFTEKYAYRLINVNCNCVDVNDV